MKLEGPIQFLVNVGLLDVILPFTLVFTLTYGLLERNKVLGTDAHRQNIIVASVLGLLCVMTINVLSIVNVLVRYLSLLLITGVMIAIVYGAAGAQFGKPNKIIIGLLITLFGITSLAALATLNLIDMNKFFNTILLPLIILAAIGASIAFVVSGKSQKEEPPKSS